MASGRKAKKKSDGKPMQQRDIVADGARKSGQGGRPYVQVGGRRLPMPRSRLARCASGSALVFLGVFGFLPVLGFWMVPLGLIILSYDVAMVRRWRRRLEVWWHRRKERRRGSK